jgi:hypothetical protein
MVTSVEDIVKSVVGEVFDRDFETGCYHTHRWESWCQVFQRRYDFMMAIAESQGFELWFCPFPGFVQVLMRESGNMTPRQVTLRPSHMVLVRAMEAPGWSGSAIHGRWRFG